MEVVSCTFWRLAKEWKALESIFDQRTTTACGQVRLRQVCQGRTASMSEKTYLLERFRKVGYLMPARLKNALGRTMTGSVSHLANQIPPCISLQARWSEINKRGAPRVFSFSPKVLSKKS